MPENPSDSCGRSRAANGGPRWNYLGLRCASVAWFVSLWFGGLTSAAAPVPASVGSGSRVIVATVHPLATQAGLDAYRAGGNAIDSAVAAALTLGVVDNHNSGLGGGCFVLIRKQDGQIIAIDGRESAPTRAGRDMFLRDGVPQPELSRTGALASGTPGALAAYALAVSEHGRLELRRLLVPAAEIAEHGFPIDRVYARNLASTASQLRRYPSSRRVLLKSDATPYQEGDVLRQPDLAATYRAIAAGGTEWFYRGPFAAAVDRWMTANGGVLSKADFDGYRAQRRVPIETTYRGHTIIGFPPPSSGGIHVAQILNILEHFDLKSLAEHDRAEYVHIVGEAMKLAFADRAHWLGDADFAKVPRGLIDKDYAASLALRIDRDAVAKVDGPGRPPRAVSDFFGKHTTHIAAADAAGNWVAITATVNTSFGSKVIIPGTGVVMNNEMDDFSIQPGVPNAFGLLGAEANAIEPGKRPLSSMSPTIVLKDGRPVLTIGAAGGPTIINQVILGLSRWLDSAEPLPDALAGPRFHHQWSPNQLLVEENFPLGLARQLEQRGHRIARRATIGVSQAIVATPAGFVGVSDPRVPGRADGL